MAKLKHYTRRLYRFETKLDGRVPIHLSRDRPVVTLQRLADHIWTGERLSAPRPRVVAGRGTPADDRTGLTSYWHAFKWEGEDAWVSEVVLSRTQRNVKTLLHELAHAMSWRGLDHGPAFVRRYLYLLATYGRCPKVLDLALQAGVL